jgi:hypothetical protein
VARDAPLGERALEDVAGAGGFVAGAGLTVGLHAPEVAADLPEVVGQAIDPQRLGIAVTEDGRGHGILVDVEADPEDWGTMGHGHGAGLLSVGGSQAAGGAGVASHTRH